MKKKLFIVRNIQETDWQLKADSMKIEGGAAIFENVEVRENKYETLVLSLHHWKYIYGFGDEPDQLAETPATEPTAAVSK